MLLSTNAERILSSCLCCDKLSIERMSLRLSHGNSIKHKADSERREISEERREIVESLPQQILAEAKSHARFDADRFVMPRTQPQLSRD